MLHKRVNHNKTLKSTKKFDGIHNTCNLEINSALNLINKKTACDIYSNIPVVTTRILGGEEVESDHEFPWTVCKLDWKNTRPKNNN